MNKEQKVDEIREHLEDAVHLAHSLMRNGNMGERDYDYFNNTIASLEIMLSRTVIGV
jgi:hypothetical protein